MAVTLMKRFARELLTTTCLSAALLCAVSPGVRANPVGGTVAGARATIGSAGSTLTVNQSSERAVIDWRGFDIAGGETTQFVQPDSSAITVNRVNSGAASQINGNLTANGNVVIINPNGVLFGSGAQVDVNGLIATTADLDNTQFMAGGKLVFTKPGNPTATVSNAGQITAKDAGLVGFVAPNVANSGVITAKLGRVHLASGDTATVDFYGDGLMEVAVSDAVSSQLVSNTGTIKADGGTVALTAAAGAQIVNSLITNTGTLQAQSVGTQNGQIVIDAGSTNGAGGVIDNTGILDASGSSGGSIALTGRNISQQGTLKADGGAGKGGRIAITASHAYIDNAQATASATGTGDAGGTITVTGGTASADPGSLFSSGSFDASGVLGGTVTLTSHGGAVSLYGVHVPCRRHERRRHDPYRRRGSGE